MALSILLLLRLVASFKTDLDLTEGVQFLQVGLNTSAKKRELVPDVVFMHLPYNFGHTVEKVGFAPQVQDRDCLRMFFPTHCHHGPPERSHHKTS